MMQSKEIISVAEVSLKANKNQLQQIIDTQKPNETLKQENIQELLIQEAKLKEQDEKSDDEGKKIFKIIIFKQKLNFLCL